MNQSRNTGKVSSALSKAQMEFPLFTVNKAGYNFEYLTLGRILEIALPILGKHNLSLVQSTSVKVVSSAPWVTVITRLSCEDEWIDSELSFPMILPTKKTDSDIGMLGSTSSYLRRYAVQSILGIAGTDKEVEEIQAEDMKLNERD